MPKQEFEVIDYMGPLVVAAIFAVVLFFISFGFLNWFCIRKTDDLTEFERFGARYNIRLGPHSMAVIKRGEYYEEADSYCSSVSDEACE